MRRLPWSAVAIVAGALIANATFMGCGSDSDPVPDEDAGSPETGPTPTPTPPTPPPPPPQDGGSDADLDGSLTDANDPDARLNDGGRDPDAMVLCKDNGVACTGNLECCTANCATLDGGGRQCATQIVACKLPGITCSAGVECCTGSCLGGVCSAYVCAADNQSCGTNGDCCSQNCVPNTVTGTGATCKTLSPTNLTTSGGPCTANADCASGYCVGGRCQSPSFCVQNNDVCSADYQCCGGFCNKASGAVAGYCTLAPSSVLACTPAGQLCGAGADGGGGTTCSTDCCSKSCGPTTTPAFACQPPSGCKPSGEVCSTTEECCGGNVDGGADGGSVVCRKTNASQAFGRCDNGQSCTPGGSICKATDAGSGNCGNNNNCCEPLIWADGGAFTGGSSFCNSGSNCCRQDALGIPRCLTVAGDCSTNPPPAGTACASSADCCGKPCVGGKCQGTCIGQGGGCTTNADCCPGLPCVLPVGSTKGTCGGFILPDGSVSDAPPPPPDGGNSDAGDAATDAGDAATDAKICSLYGQTCTATGDCCNSVPCTGGTCRFP